MSERWKLDKYSFVDTRDNSCLNFGLKDISRVILQLNNYEDLLDNYEQQLAEKDTFIKELQNDNRELRKGLNKSGLDYFISSLNSIRHQICDEWWDKCCQIIEKNEVLDIQDIKKIKHQIENGEYNG